MAKKRNPQDTTLRNTQAANKQLDELAARLQKLEEEFSTWKSLVEQLILR